MEFPSVPAPTTRWEAPAVEEVDSSEKGEVARLSEARRGDRKERVRVGVKFKEKLSARVDCT